MPKKSQDAFLEFLKKKRKEVARSRKEERDYSAPLLYTQERRKAKSALSLGGVLLGGLILLIVLNSVSLVLLLKERSKRAELAGVISETEKELARIAGEVPGLTIRSTQSSLIETQNKLRLALGETKIGELEKDNVPPLQKVEPSPGADGQKPRPSADEQKPRPSEAQPEKVEKKRTADLSVPPGQSLFPLVLMDSGEQILLVDKSSKTLFHLRFLQGKLTLANAYPCIVGSNMKDKQKEGDMATPEGIYFFVEFIAGGKLPKNYGAGAFVIDYPDFLAKLEGKTGDKVWLHGHDPDKKLDEVQSTKGCVVIDNDSLRSLSTVIKLGTTPIVIVDRIGFRSSDAQKKVGHDIISLLDGWQKAWEHNDIKKFLRFYSRDFRTADGVDFASYGQRKEQVSKGKKFIQLRLDRKAVLLSQKDSGDVAVVRFRQVYKSSNFSSTSVKSLYLKKGRRGWQIIGESVLPL